MDTQEKSTMQIKPDQKIYYKKDQALSYNIPKIIVLSERGPGKTFEYKKWCLEDYFKNENQFVWVRRKDDHELKPLVRNNADNWLNDMRMNGIIDDSKYRVRMEGEQFLINGETAGHFIPLSASLGYKGNNYDKVTKIIFDECLLNPAGSSIRYLPNEMYLLDNLYETVNRSRDAILGKPPVKLVLLGNKETIFNPYFAEIRITPFEGRFKTFKRGDSKWLVENYQNELFHQKKMASESGKGVTGTKSAASMLENEFWEGDFYNIKQRPSFAQLEINLKFEGRYYGLWRDGTFYYISDKYNLEKDTYVKLSEQTHETLCLHKKNRYYKQIMDLYQMNLLFYESIQIKHNMLLLINDLKRSV